MIIGLNINGSNMCDEYNIILIKNDKMNIMKLFLYIIVMFFIFFNKK